MISIIMIVYLVVFFLEWLNAVNILIFLHDFRVFFVLSWVLKKFCENKSL